MYRLGLEVGRSGKGFSRLLLTKLFNQTFSSIGIENFRESLFESLKLLRSFIALFKHSLAFNRCQALENKKIWFCFETHFKRDENKVQQINLSCFYFMHPNRNSFLINALSMQTCSFGF